MTNATDPIQRDGHGNGGADDATSPLRNDDGSEMDPIDSFRPALMKLDKEVRAVESDLLGGFHNRSEIVEWTQELCINTLGMVQDEWFARLAKQFRRAYDDARERPLIACLLTHDRRAREIPDGQADEIRRQIIARTIRPAKRRAFRQLRADAGEYIAEDSGAEHDAAKQRFIAMRPAVDELHERQQSVLRRLLAPNGFDGREGLLAWTRDLDLATHGEIPVEFATRCYQERSTRKTLTTPGENYDRAREFFAAAYLIPAFNRGVADLGGRAKENPDAEYESNDPVRL